jgi:hypothetical protein
VAGRAFLCGYLPPWLLFRLYQPAEKASNTTSEKAEKDLGKDKPFGQGLFAVLAL